jgi:hypothetical protein
MMLSMDSEGAGCQHRLPACYAAVRDWPSVELPMIGIENVMRHLRMTKGALMVLQVAEDMSSYKEFGVRSRRGGLWYP